MAETAKIYDLAAIRRARAAGPAAGRTTEAAKTTPSPSVGGAWYHDAAIRDDRPRQP